MSHFDWPTTKKRKKKTETLEAPPLPFTQLLIGCMEILFLKLAATIFGLDYLVALPKNTLAIELGGGANLS
jgi:hypothetical protein